MNSASQHDIKPDSPEERRGTWTPAEIQYLRRHYALRRDQQIGHELGRSVDSVRRMANFIFAGELKTGPWAASEIGLLREYIGGAELEKIAQILRRDERDVSQKIQFLRNQIERRPWDSHDRQMLKRLYGHRRDEDLVAILGRPLEDVREMANELRLAKDKAFLKRIGRRTPTPMPRWRDAEVELLRTLYPTHSNSEIAERLDRSIKSVVSKAHDLKLKKDKERLREMGRENLRIRRQNDEARKREQEND